MVYWGFVRLGSVELGLVNSLQEVDIKEKYDEISNDIDSRDVSPM